MDLDTRYKIYNCIQDMDSVLFSVIRRHSNRHRHHDIVEHPRTELRHYPSIQIKLRRELDI